VLYSPGTTPIASISPKDSVKTSLLPGKLESYKKELIEEEKEAYKRKIALDEIVSMDFSHETKVNRTQKWADTLQLHTPYENSREKQLIKKTILPASAIKKPILLKSSKTNWATEQTKAGDGFYTIRPGIQVDEFQGQPSDNNTFVKALIHGNQKVKGGGTVCLRLMEEASFYNHTYPKNTIFYGRIKGGSGGRVQISISQVKERRVELSVYDRDYREGIAYQMKEMTGEIARESREDALNEVLSSLPYGGVAGGLAQLGRNIGRKAKQTGNIYLADGYEIFIAAAR
jgi:hypothetical protein